MRRLAWLSLLLLAGTPAFAAVTVTVNGTTYTIPQTNEKGWGTNVTTWIQAISANTLQPSSGTFTLGSDLDFGPTFGLKPAYVKSRGLNPASSGMFRLTVSDVLSWRNNANSSNLNLGVNASDQLTYNGNPILGSSALTGSRAVQTDATGAVSSSAVLSTELANVSGTTSALCGINQTCVFTNKSIDGGTNTITGLTNASVSTSAAIGLSKLAALTPSRVLVSDGSGIVGPSAITSTTLGFLDTTSSVQTQLNGKQATGSYLTGLTGDVVATGPGSVLSSIQANVVTNAQRAQMAANTLKGNSTAGTANEADLTATQATGMLNTLVGDSGSGGTKGLVPAPAAGDAAAGKVLGASSLWIIPPAGSGGGGSKNYLGTTNGVNGNGSFETGTTASWGLLTTTLTGVTPTGTITASAASITTFAATATGKLAGSYSLNTASSGVMSAGQGFISTAFTLDTADQAKMQTITASYSTVSGAANLNFSGTSANTWAVYVYDVTNSAWIQPAGVYNLVQGSGVGKLQATFQTTSNSTQYRLALVCINATAGAVSMLWDDFTLGPNVSVSGPAISDSVSTTLTYDGLTVGSQSVYMSRTGDRARFRGIVTNSANVATTLAINLPAGMTIDTSKMATGTNVAAVGTAQATATTAQNIYGGIYGHVAFFDGSNLGKIYIAYQSGVTSGQFNKVNASAILNTNAPLVFDFEVPIQGWSSNSVMSSDTDTRIITASAQCTSAFVASGTVPINFDAVINDTNAAITPSVTAWKYVALVTGYYDVSVYVNSITNSNVLDVFVNGVDRAPLTNYTATQGTSGSVVVKLNAGDYFDIRPVAGNWNGAVYNGRSAYISVKRLSGPAVIAATESVNAKYNSTGSAGTVTSTAPMQFNTKEYDSHGAVTTGASWRFTAPLSGRYRLSVFTTNTTTYTATYLQLFKNGVSYELLNFINAPIDSAVASSAIRLLQGEYIEIRVTGSYPYHAASHIEIERIGNY